jgi:glycosyltransferase involved in cell wall biosynthesis
VTGISYAVTTHNEGSSIEKLLDKISKIITKNDELVILDYYSSDIETVNILKKYKNNLYKRKFNHDFSEHKNYLNSLCKKQYIFQLDGDELPSDNLIKFIQNITKYKYDIELFWIPRDNKLYNLDMTYIKKWKWVVDRSGRINYPDYQGRLFKNTHDIKWTRNVHEMITGHKNQMVLPKNAGVDILHHRDMSHQLRSIKYYNEQF